MFFSTHWTMSNGRLYCVLPSPSLPTNQVLVWFTVLLVSYLFYPLFWFFSLVICFSPLFLLILNINWSSIISFLIGTGKTQVIVSIVQQLLYRFKLKNNYRRKKILICSQSNTAIDEICLRLLDIRQQLPSKCNLFLDSFRNMELFKIIYFGVTWMKAEKVFGSNS